MINRLTKIEVKKLFGKTDYTLSFEDENDVSILIAPNGYGKTTILKLINATFNPSCQNILAIKGIVFDSISCYLSNGYVVSLLKTDTTTSAYTLFGEKNEDCVPLYGNSRRQELGRIFQDNGLNLKHTIRKKSSSNVSSSISFIETLINELPTSVALRILRNTYSSPEIDRGLMRRDNEELQEVLSQVCSSVNAALFSRGCSMPVNFITANRLRPIKNESSRVEDSQIDPLKAASEDIKAIISESLEEYGKKKTEASNLLPRLYVKKGKLKAEGYDVFKNRWSDYCQWLETFYKLGFLDSEEAEIKEITQDEYDSFGSFFDVYLDSFEKTLEPLRAIYDKFYMFQGVFNERIGNNLMNPKTILFTKDGITIKTDDNTSIPLSEMSSGEKNDLIMFFNLLFKSEAGKLVLVDEPEISLHIEWQETYIDKLIDICKENKLQAIVTTHSPHIINGHYDLLKEL